MTTTQRTTKTNWKTAMVVDLLMRSPELSDSEVGRLAAKDGLTTSRVYVNRLRRKLEVDSSVLPKQPKQKPYKPRKSRGAKGYGEPAVIARLQEMGYRVEGGSPFDHQAYGRGPIGEDPRIETKNLRRTGGGISPNQGRWMRIGGNNYLAFVLDDEIIFVRLDPAVP